MGSPAGEALSRSMFVPDPISSCPASNRPRLMKTVVIAVSRANGPTFFVLLSKKGTDADAAGVERLLNEFRALRG